MARIGPQDGRRGLLRRFARSEDGSFVLFGLFLLLAMILVGGVAVDILRHDRARVRMQNTIDTAVLAAADLDQRLPPAAVVRDYLAKNGLADALTDVTVTDTGGGRIVTATGSTEIDTMFMRAVGVERIRADAAGTAFEDIEDLELSLVLDISGSMNRDGKIGRLKDAAVALTEVLMRRPDGTLIEDEVSINLVPYSTQVNIGPALRDRMNLRATHDHSHCVEFAPAEYRSTTLDPAESRLQTAHFDALYRAYDADDQSPRAAGHSCPTNTGAGVTVQQQDLDVLAGRIRALQARGNTSIEIGLKWGAALLDPGMRPATAALDSTPDAFRDRPLEFGRRSGKKVMVVMTDGQNTRNWSMSPDYSGDAASDVYGYRDGGRWWLSVHDPEDHDRYDGDHRAGEAWYIPKTRDGRVGRWFPDPLGGTGATRLSWQELWARAGVDWHARWARGRQERYAGRREDRRDRWNGIVTTHEAATKNARMGEICEAAKARGIVIYSVALNISEDNARLMKSCASTDHHYFNVNDRDLVRTFTEIAASINVLQLIR